MSAKKNKGGRPMIVLTDEQVEKVEELAAYLTCEQIADYLGISHVTFQEIRSRQEAVSFAYKKGKSNRIYKYGLKLENKAMGVDDSGDTSAIIFYLKTQAGWSTEPKRDSDRKPISFSGNTALEIFNSGFEALSRGEIDLEDMRAIGDLALMKMNIENKGEPEVKAEDRHMTRAESLEYAMQMREARETMEMIIRDRKGN